MLATLRATLQATQYIGSLAGSLAGTRSVQRAHADSAKRNAQRATCKAAMRSAQSAVRNAHRAKWLRATRKATARSLQRATRSAQRAERQRATRSVQCQKNTCSSTPDTRGGPFGDPLLHRNSLLQRYSTQKRDLGPPWQGVHPARSCAPARVAKLENPNSIRRALISGSAGAPA